MYACILLHTSLYKDSVASIAISMDYGPICITTSFCMYVNFTEIKADVDQKPKNKRKVKGILAITLYT